jgi:ketosteroid isomerase-like protein
MKHTGSANLVSALYEARERGDLETVRSMLSDEVVWHEPDVGSEYTGDLRGPDAVIRMIHEAGELSGGSFRLVPRAVVANGEHAVAMVDWSAERDGERLEGKEVAVYRIRAGRVVEASFHQDDADLDRQFWR